MKEMEVGMKVVGMESKLKPSLPPPPPPPLPQISTWSATRPTKVCQSVTREEIARFWRRKKMEEEDHLLAAIKAAARIRARNLTEEDYKQFDVSLMSDSDENNDKSSSNDDTQDIRVGIKDWWTKSKFAYLNQPAIQWTDPPKRSTNAYMPNLCFYKAPPPQSYSLGVF